MMVIMGRTISANRHYQELDSLRGLAAITVLISHYLYPFLVENGPYVGIALLAFTHALYGTIPVVAILLLASVTSVFIAWLSYEFVERPAIKLGKVLSSRWKDAPGHIGAKEVVLNA